MKLFTSTLVAALVASHAATAAPQSLTAGAAKLDFTPAASALPKSFEGVQDPVFIRALVVDNGATRAALVSVDAIAITSDTWKAVARRAEAELRIPADQILLTATHTHSVPIFMGRKFEDDIFAALKAATERRRPAKISFGSGASHINVNRNLVDPQTGRWREGPNYEGVSDKTVAVMKVEAATGEPIALYYNYAVHAVLTGMLDKVSADIPGAASRYVEDSIGGDVVAMWSTAAEGDQNPLYFNQTYDLREIRVRAFAKQGKDITNAMPPGGQGLDKQDPEVARLLEQQKKMTEALGQMLGEEILRVNRTELGRASDQVSIDGAQSTVSCPGRKRTDAGRAGVPGEFVDAEPVPIRLSVLKLGDVVIGGVDAEVFTAIGQRFKAASPFKATMMATLTNGYAPSGYIPSDAAFGYQTFEVLSSRLKPGCAEGAIVNGLVDLIEKANRPTPRR